MGIRAAKEMMDQPRDDASSWREDPVFETSFLSLHIPVLRPILAIITLIVLAALLTVRQIDDGGFRYPDEPRNALSGVFILDFITSGNWSDPVRFAEEYYARYPALNIPYYSPPLFHIVEAVYFAIFDISAITARHCVLAFHLLATILLFVFTRKQYGSPVAFVTGVFFLTSPIVLECSRQVVLEPAATAMLLWSCLTWLRAFKDPTASNLAWWILSLAAALMTKQTVAFIVPVQLSGLLIAYRHHIVSWAMLIVVGGVMAGYFIFWRATSPYHVESFTALLHEITSWSHLSYYPRMLPEILGWPVLILSLMGFVFLTIRRWRSDIAFLSLAVGFWLMMLATDRLYPRYAYLCVPFFCLAAAQITVAVSRVLKPWLPMTLSLGLAMAPNVVTAVVTPSRVVDGFEQSAVFVARQTGGASILIDGLWDGDLVFFLRQHDPEKRVVLRGNKVLDTYASYPWKRYASFVKNEKGLMALLDALSVRYIVVEDVESERRKSNIGQILRDALRGPSFNLLAQIPVRKVQRGLAATHILVYEYPSAPPLSSAILEVPIPGLNRTVQVPIKHLAQ